MTAIDPSIVEAFSNLIEGVKLIVDAATTLVLALWNLTDLTMLIILVSRACDM